MALYNFFGIPYRDTETREKVRNKAFTDAEAAYKGNISAVVPVFTRPGYWYDIQAAETSGQTSPYNNSNAVTLGTLTTPVKGFGYGATFELTGPLNKTYVLYGIENLSANPVSEALILTINGKTYPIMYVASDVDVSEDHKMIFNGDFPALIPSQSMTIQVLGSAAGTDKLNFLFAVAEQNPGQA